jgi:hypothetical protein
MRDSNDEPNNNITMEDYRTDLIEDKSNLDNIRKFLSKVRK